jgi:hypothetical protein
VGGKQHELRVVDVAELLSSPGERMLVVASIADSYMPAILLYSQSCDLILPLGKLFLTLLPFSVIP